jgi:hypothetical protein
MKKTIFFLIIFLLVSTFSFAEEEDDIELFGLELEKLLNLGSGILAAGLFTMTLASYKRSGNKRLLFVILAFLLFAAKNFLVGSEIFFDEWSLADPIASSIDFAVLISFFIGILKRR